MKKNEATQVDENEMEQIKTRLFPFFRKSSNLIYDGKNIIDFKLW